MAAAKTLKAVSIIWLVLASPALAFDTSQLGQGGTVILTDLMPVIGKSAPLKREVSDALTKAKKQTDDVICSGMRFPGQWVHLGGERVSPYICDFGGRWLQIQATVQIAGKSGQVFQMITPNAMKNATKVNETNLTWKWTTENPEKTSK